MNLGELVRARQRRRLLTLINQLPPASRYTAAVSNDDEHVALLIEAMERQPKTDEKDESGPSLAGWTPEVDKLTEISDLLAQNLSVAIAAAGGKPKPMKPSSRPVSAFARVKERKTVSAHKSVVQRMAEARARKDRVTPVDWRTKID